jgi:hypothetical protein
MDVSATSARAVNSQSVRSADKRGKHDTRFWRAIDQRGVQAAKVIASTPFRCMQWSCERKTVEQYGPNLTRYHCCYHQAPWILISP